MDLGAEEGDPIDGEETIRASVGRESYRVKRDLPIIGHRVSGPP
jgi:hypothetical protein